MIPAKRPVRQRLPRIALETFTRVVGGLSSAQLDPAVVNNVGGAIALDSYGADLDSFPTILRNDMSEYDGDPNNNNERNAVCVFGGSITSRTGKWSSDSVFVIQESVTIANGGRLDIEPPETGGPMVVEFEDDEYLTVSGTLAARGTESANVVFTSDHDDEFRGDTDGAEIKPEPGDWAWVYFAPDSNDSTCIVENAVFRYGGKSGSTERGAIRIRGASPPIRYNEFTQNLCGIYAENDSAPMIDRNCFTDQVGVFNDSPVLVQRS